MSSKVCYIFGAGEYYGTPPVINEDDYIIAADGGLEYLRKNRICADLIVGDFDSCIELPTGNNVILLPKEKDMTDMAMAIQLGYEHGFRCFRVYGGVGGRIDHTLANIQCIAELATMGAKGYLMDNGNIITAIRNSEIRFQSGTAGYVSVFAHTDTAAGVCEEGFKFSLDNATLYNTNPLGVSNELIGEQSRISVREGTLIIVYPINALEV